jgi:hypothetical protein
MKPPRRQGIVIAIVSRDRGNAEVRRAVIEGVEAEALGNGEIVDMRVY